MKEPISYPPNIKVSEWVKDMIGGMLTVDESKRLGIYEVKKIIETHTGAMDLEWGVQIFDLLKI